MHFEVDQAKARQLNISSQDIESYLQMSLSGDTITHLRERDKLIGVDLRAPPPDRIDPSQVEQLAVPSIAEAASQAVASWSALGSFSLRAQNTDVDVGSGIANPPSPCNPTFGMMPKGSA